MHFLVPFIVKQIVIAATADKLKEFVDKEDGLSTGVILGSPDFEERLIDWLNGHIDIPFMSEDAEEEVIKMVISIIKGRLLGMV